MHAVSAAAEKWPRAVARGSKFGIWHSFRELSGVSCGAAIAAFVIMLAVPS
jgi:hypothetical protein